MLHRGEWTVSNMGQSAGGSMSFGCLSREDRLQAKQAKPSGEIFFRSNTLEQARRVAQILQQNGPGALKQRRYL